MHITTGELALAGIGGTLLGAIGGAALGYFGQLHSAKTTLAGQRQLAEDQRLWDRRATEYPILVELVWGTWRRFSNAIRVKDPIALRTAFNTDEFQRGFARVLSFSSAQIQEQMNYLIDAMNALVTFTDDTYYPQGTDRSKWVWAEPPTHMLSDLVAVAAATVKMLQAEMQGMPLPALKTLSGP